MAWSGRETRVALLAAGVAAGLALWCLVRWDRSTLDSDAAAVHGLVEAMGERRFFAPRPAGGFKYGEIVSRTRDATTGASDSALFVAALAVERAARRDPTPARRRAWAVAELLVGREDAAARDLAQLAAAQPTEAAVQNDLAVAYLVTAARRPENAPRALEAAERAVELQPASVEAAYNRALALEAMALAEPAHAAWRELVPRLAGSAWAAEAQQHIDSTGSMLPVDPDARPKALEEALAAGDAAGLRRLIRDSVDSAFAFYQDRLLANPQRWGAAGHALYGEAFRAVTGDVVIAATAAQVARGHRAAETRAALALLLDARAAMEAYQWSKARPQMALATAALRRAAVPMRGWAAVYTAILDLSASRFALAEAELGEVLGDPALRDQPLLRARALYARSVATVRQGRLSETLADRRAAHDLFAAAGDQAWAGFMSQQVAEVFAALGRASRGWSDRIESVRYAGGFARRRRTILALEVVGDDCRDAGLPRASQRLYGAAVRMAQRDGDPIVIADALLGLTWAVAAVDPRALDGHLATAAAAIDRIPDPGQVELYRGELRRVRAESESGPPSARQAALTDAIDWLEARRQWGRSLPLRESRARLLDGLGRREAARADMEEIVRRSGGREVDELDLSASSLRAVLAAFEYLATADTQAGVAAANVLTLAERRWQTSFKRRIAPPRPGVASEVTARLAGDACVLAYLPTEGTLLSWVLAPGRITMQTQPLTKPALAALTEEAAESARGRASAPAFEGLRHVLFAGQEGALESCRRVYVVGSGATGRVPWASFRRAWPIGPAPQFSLVPSLEYLLAAGAHPEEPVPTGGALGVSVAAADGDLPPLQGATGEAALAVSMAGGGERLDGARATRTAVERALRRATLFHFAGHGLTNLEHPAQSSLVLAGVRGGADYWTLDRIVALRPGAVSVAVLAACRSADQASPDGEAELSLARGFLEAGAGSVVGTLWDISDEDMSVLMRRFYTALFRDRLSPGTALARLGDDQVAVTAQALVLHSARGALAH